MERKKKNEGEGEEGRGRRKEKKEKKKDLSRVLFWLCGGCMDSSHLEEEKRGLESKF